MLTNTASTVNDTKLLADIISHYPSLRYVIGVDGTYFIGKEVEQAAGKAGDHFYRSYQRFVQSDRYQPDLYQQPLKVRVLEGDTLYNYKNKFEQKYGESLGSVNRLLVATAAATHHYLGLDDQLEKREKYLLTVNDIPQTVSFSFPQSQKPKPQIKMPKSSSFTQFKREEDLTKELASLSSYTPYPFRREYTVVNTLTDQVERTRRFDLYRTLSDNTVQAVEVKKVPLTAEHISITLGDKGYLDLLSTNTDNTVEFIFVAPSLNPAAIRLLNLLPNISFLTVEELVIQLMNEIKDSLPTQGQWFIKDILKEFQDVFPFISSS